MSRFLDALNSCEVLLMDGGMGTELQRAGLQPSECGELWNLIRPWQVQQIYQSYRDAGAKCFLTNTFQANPSSLRRHGNEDATESISRTAINIIRAVCRPTDFVVGDIGPLDWESDDAFQVARALSDADAILVETWTTTLTRHHGEIFHRIKLESGNLPLLLSCTFNGKSGRGGSDLVCGDLNPEQVALIARSFEIAALGVNCGRNIGLEETIKIIGRYRTVCDLPLFARPNAGTPARIDNRWVYPLGPEELGNKITALLEAGIAMIGGCCGMTPKHIAALKPKIDSWNAYHRVSGERYSLGSKDFRPQPG